MEELSKSRPIFKRIYVETLWSLILYGYQAASKKMCWEQSSILKGLFFGLSENWLKPPISSIRKIEGNNTIASFYYQSKIKIDKSSLSETIGQYSSFCLQVSSYFPP